MKNKELKVKYDRERYQNCKEDINRRSMQYYHANKEKRKRDYKAYYRKNIVAHLLKAARRRANEKNIEFTLVKEDIFLPDVCPVLGTKFEVGTLYCYSIDRIDNEGGYTADNIQVISKKANFMKYTATPEELVKFAKWILEIYNG